MESYDKLELYSKLKALESIVKVFSREVHRDMLADIPDALRERVRIQPIPFVQNYPLDIAFEKIERLLMELFTD